MLSKKSGLIGLATITLLTSVQPAFANNKEGIGTVLGGIIGGVLGNATGDSHVSRRNGTIIGALIGGFIGNRIGASMDEDDRRAYAAAQRQALESRIGEEIEWEGSDYGSHTGATGTVVSTGEGYHRRNGNYCRIYKSDFRVRGRSESSKAAACLDHNGRWYDVDANEVRWNTTRSDDGGLPDSSGSVSSGSNSGAHAIIGAGSLATNITRKSGGEWIRFKLNNPTILEKLHLEVRNSSVKIHQMVVYTRQGQKVPIRFNGTNDIFRQGEIKSLDLRRIGVSTGSVDIRVESYGGVGTIKLLLQDLHGDEAKTRTERF